MKKGFTLIELIISFAIISIVSVALFKSVLSVQQKQSREVSYNSFVAFSYILNNTIQDDFTTKRIIEVNSYGVNDYGIVYENEDEIRLQVLDNSIIYGSTKEKIPSGYSLYGDIEFTTYATDESGINSYLLLTIPLKDESSSSFNDLKFIYQVDNRVTLIPPIG